MDLWGRVLCLFNRHKPGGGKVEWDGRNYIGKCARCDASIRRQSHGHWRRDWLKLLAVLCVPALHASPLAQPVQPHRLTGRNPSQAAGKAVVFATVAA